MTVFQSLGSNYTARYAWKHLFTRGSQVASEQLTTLLEERYSGKAFLYSKGRNALATAVRLTAEHHSVALNGITCSVVPEAAQAANANLSFVDIDTHTGNMSLSALENSLKTNSDITAVVVQNSFGNMIDIVRVEQLARKYNLFIIEDLAHSIGQTYADGREAGTVGDLVMLSFGRDKTIDAVNGGALIVRNQKLSVQAPSTLPSGMQQFRDRIYPLLTCLVRSLYTVGIGRVLLRVSFALKLIVRSSDGHIQQDQTLPHWQAKRIYRQLAQLPKNLQHRQRILSSYSLALEKQIINPAGAIRAVLLVANRQELLNKLSQRGYMLQDTWYDVPVGPLRKYAEIEYPEAECPNAVLFSQQAVNLPTHVHISPQIAKQIASHIKEYSS